MNVTTTERCPGSRLEVWIYAERQGPDRATCPECGRSISVHRITGRYKHHNRPATPEAACHDDCEVQGTEVVHRPMCPLWDPGLECVACGRALTNDDAPNQAWWTLSDDRLPYCGDSVDCQRDAYRMLGVET